MSNNQVDIVAPLPGVFYRQSSPDSPAYKNEGDRVAVGEVIGLVEVMKTFTEIQSEVAGKILKFCVANEAYVEIGQVIAEVEALN